MNTMSDYSERKGAWLEVQAQLKTRDSIDEWLAEDLGVPLKLLHKLNREQGIRQKTDSILLHLFPDEYDEYRADWMEIEVIYEDDFCLVVNKPAHLKVHPTHAGEEHTLANAVAAHYLHTGQSCKIRHIHRLDEQTSGAVLYAKNELAQLKLDEQMRLKTIQRQYIAFVQGMMKPSKGTIDEPIGRDRHHPSRRRVSPSGDPAVTHYEVIEFLQQVTLLRLRLETGRTHQIRVHLSHLRHPILGDELYGGNRSRMHRQALHGDLLTFPHPFFQRNIEVNAPWPTDLLNLLTELQF
jgi:23S rRNA pseudouridine1911/1915/1917 synthase